MLEPKSWTECDNLAHTRKRKLANNTYLDIDPILSDGNLPIYYIRLHRTRIIAYHPDGTIKLNSGGWQTVTTKERMNRFSPARVYSDKGIWYIGTGNWEDGIRYEFFDGIKIGTDGIPLNVEPAPRTNKLKTKLDRLVREYIKGYIDSLMEAKDIPLPTNGDCWGCLMRDVKEKEYNPRDQVMGFDHYLSHFEDKYYVPSIAMQAIKVRHYRDPGFIYQLELEHVKKGERPRILEQNMIYFFRMIKPQLLKEMQSCQPKV